MIAPALVTGEPSAKRSKRTGFGGSRRRRTKLLLAFRSILIEKATGIVLSYGQIIYGPDFSSVTISLSTCITKVKGMLCRVDELATQQDPAFFLCSHCEICEFGPSCLSRAVAEDSMSLIRGIG